MLPRSNLVLNDVAGTLADEDDDAGWADLVWASLCSSWISEIIAMASHKVECFEIVRVLIQLCCLVVIYILLLNRSDHREFQKVIFFLFFWLISSRKFYFIFQYFGVSSLSDPSPTQINI